jgi:hypothetical protein
MAGAILILGLLILWLTARRPLNRPLLSRATRISILVLGVLYLGLIVFLILTWPLIVPRLIGQTVGAILILFVFAAVGGIIRKTWKS